MAYYKSQKKSEEGLRGLPTRQQSLTSMAVLLRVLGVGTVEQVRKTACVDGLIQQLDSREMRRYQIELKFGSLKELKHGLTTCNYYLVASLDDQTSEISPCRDILYQQGIYCFATDKSILRLQVWHYDTSKRVGTLQIQKQTDSYEFDCIFQKANLKLSLKAWWALLGPMRDSNAASKSVTLTKSSSTSQNSCDDEEV